jgi:hypothetical protein
MGNSITCQIRILTLHRKPDTRTRYTHAKRRHAINANVHILLMYRHLKSWTFCQFYITGICKDLSVCDPWTNKEDNCRQRLSDEVNTNDQFVTLSPITGLARKFQMSPYKISVSRTAAEVDICCKFVIKHDYN